MRKLFLPLSIILVLLASCQNKPSVTAAGDAILHKGKWKVTSGMITMKLPSGKDSTINYLALLDNCLRDDYVKFDSGILGYYFNGALLCSPADADSVAFNWKLFNNNTAMNIYNAFHFIDSVYITIDPFHIDTLAQTPTLVLDTIISTPTFVELDTIRPLTFHTTATQNVNIYNANVTNFSQSSFTLNFYILGYYPDSNNFHTLNPIFLPDTFKYSVTYSNY